MNQYVNKEPFLAWYRSVSKAEPTSEGQMLYEVFTQYGQTHREEFELPGDRTKSGQPERYPFRFEHLNCCGADQVNITF